MGRVLSVLLVLGMLAVGFGGCRAAQERPSAELTVDVLSQYVWRGLALSDDSVVIQPSMTVSYLGAYVNLWGNYDTDRDNEHAPALKGADWNETDFTFGYIYDELPYGVVLDIGGIYYALDGDDSLELFGGLLAICPKTGIGFGLRVYREISHYPATWLELSAARDFDLPWYGASLALSVSAMYLASADKGAYPDPDDPEDEFSGWSYLQVGAEISFPVGKYLTVTPKIYYSFSLSEEADHLLEDGSWDNHHDHFFGGVGVSFAF